jgi:hypothetical protein
MCDAVIYYLYHKCDEVVEQNYDSIKRHNPDIEIIGINNGSNDSLPNSIKIEGTLPGLIAGEHTVGDYAIYQIYKRSEVRAERYICLEWDVYCNMSFKEFFATGWNADLTATHFFTPEKDPHWAWFYDVNKLPTILKDHATGTVPTAVMLLSNRFMEFASEYNFPEGRWFNSELRLPTLANAYKFIMNKIPDSTRTIKWLAHTIPQDVSPKGIYHPVKVLKKV